MKITAQLLSLSVVQIICATSLLLGTRCAAEDLHLLTPALASGTTDATSAIQASLDAAAIKGGSVRLPPGQYLIRGSLRIPSGVTFAGSWEEPHHGVSWQKGTTLLITGGRGDENAPAAIAMDANSAIKGFTLVWPEQVWNDIKPYPWAIQGRATHVSVENVTLVNAYQGIEFGSDRLNGSLHLARNIFGCVLRRGVFVDSTTDIGRIENVHFNPHYWLGSGHPSVAIKSTPASPTKNNERNTVVIKYLADNLEAFTFGRSDWEYCFDTFVYGAKSGYRFVKTRHGACNGQFLGIGADYCKTCVQIRHPKYRASSH